MLLHRRSPSPSPLGGGEPLLNRNSVSSSSSPVPCPNMPCQATSSMYKTLPTPGMVDMMTIHTAGWGKKSNEGDLEMSEPLLYDEDAEPKKRSSSSCCCCAKEDSDKYVSIYVLNAVTVFIHLVMLCVTWGVVQTRTTKLYSLKMDRIHVVPMPTPGSNLTATLPYIRKAFLNRSNGIYLGEDDVRTMQRDVLMLSGNQLNSTRDELNAQCRQTISQLFSAVNSTPGIQDKQSEFERAVSDLQTSISGKTDAARANIISATNELARSTERGIADKAFKAYESTVNTDFLQMRSPYYASWKEWPGQNSAYNVSHMCGLAKPNLLTFQGGVINNIDLQMWVYPKESETKLNLGWMVACFFTLSFFMQLPFLAFSCNCVQSNCLRYFSYDYIFGKSYDDENSGYREKNPLLFQFEHICKKEIRFNWLRFVEYSGSGSLVLATVALTAGIFDIELLGCMFGLSAVCMLLGLVAEVLWRARNVLLFVRNLVVVNPNRMNPEDNSKSMLYSDETWDHAKKDIDEVLNEPLETKYPEGIPALGLPERTQESIRTLDSIRGLTNEVMLKISKSNFMQQEGSYEDFKNNLMRTLDGVMNMSMNVRNNYVNDIENFQRFAKTEMEKSHKQSTDKLTKKIVVRWLGILANSLLGAFWLTHILAWVCIAIPWAIILQHFGAWWEPCNAGSLDISNVNQKLNNVIGNMLGFNLDDGYGGRREPPDFVRVSFLPSLQCTSWVTLF